MVHIWTFHSIKTKSLRNAHKVISFVFIKIKMSAMWKSSRFETQLLLLKVKDLFLVGQVLERPIEAK